MPKEDEKVLVYGKYYSDFYSAIYHRGCLNKLTFYWLERPTSEINDVIYWKYIKLPNNAK